MKNKYLVAGAIFVIVGIALFAVLAFFVAPGTGATAAPLADLDAETMRISKELYCPVCPGTPLDVCETQACQQWRARIRDQLAQGSSAEQVRAFFVEQYGERVLGAPRPQGLNVIIYVVPAFALAGGAALLYLYAVGRARPAATVATNADIENATRARIERELAENE